MMPLRNRGQNIAETELGDGFVSQAHAANPAGFYALRIVEYHAVILIIMFSDGQAHLRDVCRNHGTLSPQPRDHGIEFARDIVSIWAEC